MNEPTTRARRLAAPVTRTTALFLGAAMLLTGCAVAQQNATADPVGEPVEGGTLRVAAAADAQPQFVMANRAGNWSWRRLVFESLVEIDDESEPQPLLATGNAASGRSAGRLNLRDTSSGGVNLSHRRAWAFGLSPSLLVCGADMTYVAA